MIYSEHDSQVKTTKMSLISVSLHLEVIYEITLLLLVMVQVTFPLIQGKEKRDSDKGSVKK